MDYKRFAGESEDAYIYRICSKKEQIGTWDDVAKILNSELEHDYTSSKYRKPFQDYHRVYDIKEPEIIANGALLEEIREERKALEREKVKLRDERNAYNRKVRNEARKESLRDIILREIKAAETEWPAINSPVTNITDAGDEMVVMLSDLHAGLGADNYWNYYDNDEMYGRLEQYLNEIEKIRQRHNVKKAHFILGGDVINGNIHLSLRIENRENVVKQIMTVAVALSDFFAVVASMFNEIHIYSVAGNHSRVSSNKAEHLKGENLDELIPFYMQAKLQNCKNIEFHENTIDESIGSLYVAGQLAYFAHGDKDNVSSVVQKLTMMTGQKPRYVFLGHRHTNALTTVYDTKVIECGCLSGTDSYCVDHRLKNRPEQVVAICSAKGLECLYDVKF